LIWADGQLLEESRYHHWVLWIRFDGGVDVERFRRAWDDTVRNHDALSLVVDTRAPRQRFATGLPELRLVEVPEDVSLEQWVGEQATRDFVPSRQPLEANLVSSPRGELAFVLRAHYAICDERSFQIIASELSDRYEGRGVGTARPFRERLLRVTDPAALERESAERAAWDRALAEPPPVAIPTNAETSERLGVTRVLRWYNGAEQARLRTGFAAGFGNVELGEDLHQVFVLTLTFAWLHLLTGQRDLVIAVPFDSRDASRSETVGQLSEAFYLRVEVEESDTLAALADKVRRARAFLAQHSHVAIGDPNCVSAYVGSLPAWPTRFCGNLAHFRLGSARVFTDAGLGDGDGREPLALRCITDGANLGVVFDFAKSRFAESDCGRLSDSFFRLLFAWLEAPATQLGWIDWVPEQETERLRALGAGRTPPLAPDLLEVFSTWVEQTPTKTAVEFGTERLSYEQLDRFARRLARRLRHLGVGPESRVAVAMPRGFGEVVALLGTLMAQGAYVPLDPTHPVDRVRVILEDAQPEVVIAPSSSPVAGALPSHARFCALDDVLRDLQDGPDDPIGDGSGVRERLAYILFTSGSTGRPKGVEISRGAFANFLQSMANEPGLSSRDRVVAITTTTFDIAGLELFLPLYVGATIVVADKETATDPAQLNALFERSDISLMQATPATWRLLLDAGFRGREGLRMLCGGEAMSLALAKRLLACGAELWNVYGPTETTVWSTLERIEPGVERITIGHPIDHTQITLRDPQGRLVLHGAIGEICIGGLGLARGYRGRPDLTEERFCFDPRTGERYYRTGDLGRYLPDGRLECLGRLDHQIKVRGFRIEPSDIEAQLRTVEGVKEVLVVAHSKDGEEPQLVAYWVGAATLDALHAVAKAKLPYYMVPSAYVGLAAFPLTTSGKIDRKALPPPHQVSANASHAEGLAPRNDRETVIGALFRQVLGLDFVPVDRDFFTLGGTSVSAVQLRTRIADTTGVSLPLRTLFDNPTVAGIAEQLDKCPNEDDPVVSWLKPAAARAPWIGIMGVRLFEDIARALPADQPFLAIHVPARFVPHRDPFPSVVDLARKYVEVIRKHQPEGPYSLVGLCHGGVVAFEVAVQLEALGARVDVVGLLDAELPQARHIRRGVQLSGFLRQLIVEPQVAGARSLQALSKLLKPAAVGAEQSVRDSFIEDPIDMPLDGPEIDRELDVYEGMNHVTRASVLTFRATRSDLPPWVAIAPDLGWSGRAARVVSYDVPSSHLGIVRQPHATQVAAALNDAKSAAGG
jgi:amino acid adenylation domain-containing protein